MYGESVCFTLGLNKELSSAVEVAVATLNAKTRPLRRLDQSTSNRLMTIGAGCVVVSKEMPNSLESLSSFFLTQRLWMPVICLSEVPIAKPGIIHQTGTFARVIIPIAHAELANVLQQALKCDALGAYSPAELRRKMLQLTRREKQTIDQFLQGNNTKVVAKNLAVTHQTVDKHRGRALRKLGMKTVVDLLNTLHLTMLQSIGFDLEPLLQPSTELVPNGMQVNVSGRLPDQGHSTDLRRDAG